MEVDATEETLAVLADVRMQQEQTLETLQEPESMRTQSSTEGAAIAAKGTTAESSTAASLRAGGKSSCGEPSHACAQHANKIFVLCASFKTGADNSVHAISGSCHSYWKKEYKNYLACIRTKSGGICVVCSFHEPANIFRWFAWRPQGLVCRNIKHVGRVVLFKYPANLEDQEDKFYMRELGKNTSGWWIWNPSMTSMWGYAGLQPWPPPCSLRISCLSKRGVVLSTWVQSIRTGVAAWEESMRKKYGKSPLGKYRIRKESNCIRKDLIRMTCIYF
jgi:hypothetical protein